MTIVPYLKAVCKPSFKVNKREGGYGSRAPLPETDLFFDCPRKFAESQELYGLSNAACFIWACKSTIVSAQYSME